MHSTDILSRGIMATGLVLLFVLQIQPTVSQLRLRVKAQARAHAQAPAQTQAQAQSGPPTTAVITSANETFKL